MPCIVHGCVLLSKKVAVADIFCLRGGRGTEEGREEWGSGKRERMRGKGGGRKKRGGRGDCPSCTIKGLQCHGSVRS